MARNKKPKRKVNQPVYPKSLKIVEADEEFRLYKVWIGNKVSKEPFLITDNLEDLVGAYEEWCKKWKIKKPDIKGIRALVNKYQQNKKVVTNEEANFLKGHYK